MKRIPASIMCTCVVPWDEQGQFLEPLFVDEVQTMLRLTPHLYVFGTAGEGHAVSNRQFENVTRVFHETMKVGGAEAMVGVISLSLPTMLERIDWCRDLGIRKFQVSLPSWGALTDAEVGMFFREVCGRFRDCQFLHYNLMRTKRLVTPEQYAELAAEHPNLVATKNSTDSMDRLKSLIELAPQLQHFLTETGYMFASMVGECGLLASIATNHAACRNFFEAGQKRDMPKMLELHAEISKLIAALIGAAGPNCHIDSAFDKLLWKLSDERFPLRLLPPYQGPTDEGFRQFAEAVPHADAAVAAGTKVTMVDLDPDDDCPLPVRVQKRNVACFATFWGMFYLAAPVSYIGLTHANLLKRLGNSDTVSNLPSAVYMWLTVVPVLAAWFFPQPRYSRRLGFCALGLMAAMTFAVALTLSLSNSASLATAVVIAHGALFGAANGVALATLWDLLRRGVSTSRRGMALGLAYGIGPLFACVGSLLQDALLNGEMLGGRTFGLEFPQNYLAMFAGGAPLLLFAGMAISSFVVPESTESDSGRESVLAEIRAGLKQFIRTRFVLFAVIIYVIVYSGGNAIFSNVSLHAKDVLPMEGDTVGVQNFLRFGCKAVAGALLGLLLAKANPRATLVATTSTLLVGMTWALTSSGWWFMATFGILGAGELFGAHFPNYVTSASSKAFVRLNIAYLSVLSTMVGFSSLAFGLISDHFGRIASFYAAAVSLGLALVLIYVLLPANPTPRETGRDFTATS